MIPKGNFLDFNNFQQKGLSLISYKFSFKLNEIKLNDVLHHEKFDPNTRSGMRGWEMVTSDSLEEIYPRVSGVIPRHVYLNKDFLTELEYINILRRNQVSELVEQKTTNLCSLCALFRFLSVFQTGILGLATPKTNTVIYFYFE